VAAPDVPLVVRLWKARLDICELLICPLLLPSGIPAHVPGVPAVTFTHAATPFAVAPEFCSMSPCDHVNVVGALDDFVGI
jgi:hypothetical protein